MEPASKEASEESAQVLLTVQDSGPGVPVDLRQVIFEPFRQAEDGKSRRLEGTGLGLAIVSDLVRLHGGTIQVDEASGGGARFTICLPQHAPPGTAVQHEDDTDGSRL
jgi:signal transduction histidine kinase